LCRDMNIHSIRVAIQLKVAGKHSSGG
jgi:hypothetical protein